MTGRVISTGSILIDLTFRVPQPPEPGGDVLAGPPTVTVAGGYNLLVAAARQGVPAVYAGTVGTGPYATLVRTALAESGIVASSQPRLDGDTGVCVVMVDDSAERTFITSPGAETLAAVSDLDRSRPSPADLIAVSGYDLAYPQSGRTVAQWVHGLPTGCAVALDPGPMVDDIPAGLRRDVVARTEILTLNRREAALVGGMAGDDRPVDRRWHDAVRDAWHFPAERLLIIRDGARGCTAGGGELGAEIRVVPAPIVVAVDTTGAGDTHTGVLLAGLLQRRGVVEALSRATVAAAYSVTVRGPAASPTADELERLVATSGAPGRR